MRHHLAVIMAVCLWGSSFIASTIAMRVFSPLLLCFIRSVVSSLVLFAVRVKKGVRKANGNDLKYVCLSALFGVSLYYAIESLAVSMTSASSASLISAVYPIVTVLMGLMFFSLKVSISEVIGIIAGVIGVMIITVSSPGGDDSLTGNFLIAFNGCLWALFNYLTQKISPDLDDFSMTYHQTLIATVLFLPLLLLEKPEVGASDLASVSAVLYLSLFCSLAALLFYNYGLRQVSAAQAASLMNLMPVAGVILSVLVLHENVSLRHLVGGAIIISGVLLSAKKHE